VFQQVLIAGVGALGSEVAKNVGLLGSKSVFIADPDIVEPRNIGHSVLLCQAPVIGQSKVSQALDRLRTWFPRTDWNGDSVEIADVDSQQFSKAEILFGCVDTDLARTEIAALSARFGLPVCDAGLGGTSTRVGRVSWLPGAQRSACFACLLTNRRRAMLLNLWESDVHACWARNPAEECADWTTTPTMASIIAGLQVELALSASKNRDTDAFSLRLDLDYPSVSETIRHLRSPGCPLHDDVPEDLFPICTLAECMSCGNMYVPGQRIGWVRRRGACPSCGSRELTIRESSRGQLARSSS